ncbi:hypothetical protein JQS43_00740 [Natronosporangium hydrolyticum]|uniref:PAS domain-containing protein n=1 Tax=Natronosporangium hydrolyticum TaxID=2811111 RepID=A0A895YB31_9ACTN|nr:hypothetical protein [Natronosporangium hydrolyticum]QSB14957.1 hypothetical protein JQS43_00740 [Natronosporangium hydrolyticum]
MPHVELSLIDSRRLPRSPAPGPAGRSTDLIAPGSPAVPPPAPPTSLHRWAAVVTEASEPSLVLDAQTVIVAASTNGAQMLGCGAVANTVGRRMREAVTQLVDFSNPPDKLDSAEAGKTPPLLAISSRQLARGLMRVQCPDTGRTCIMDAVATPLWERGQVVGSLTFFSQV